MSRRGASPGPTPAPPRRARRAGPAAARPARPAQPSAELAFIAAARDFAAAARPARPAQPSAELAFIAAARDFAAHVEYRDGCHSDENAITFTLQRAASFMLALLAAPSPDERERFHVAADVLATAAGLPEADEPWLLARVALDIAPTQRAREAVLTMTGRRFRERTALPAEGDAANVRTLALCHLASLAAALEAL